MRLRVSQSATRSDPALFSRRFWASRRPAVHPRGDRSHALRVADALACTGSWRSLEGPVSRLSRRAPFERRAVAAGRCPGILPRPPPVRAAESPSGRWDSPHAPWLPPHVRRCGGGFSTPRAGCRVRRHLRFRGCLPRPVERARRRVVHELRILAGSSGVRCFASPPASRFRRPMHPSRRAARSQRAAARDHARPLPEPCRVQRLRAGREPRRRDGRSDSPRARSHRAAPQRTLRPGRSQARARDPGEPRRLGRTAPPRDPLDAATGW